MLQHLLRVGAAGAWLFVGRGAGLVWTLTLIASLGFGPYGMYAAAFALAAVLSAPLENVFVVRSVRVGEEEYVRERLTRFLLGCLLVVIGAAWFAWSFIVGFGLVVAGAEMIFNSYKSLPVRIGLPERVLRMDALRQYASIACGVVVLLVLRGDASIQLVSLAYLAPYVVVLALAARRAWGPRPAFPGGWRENATLLGDAVVISLYLQGDILILSWLAGEDAVGVYSLASQLALALAMLGQVYAQTFNERLRESRGHVSSGPPLRVLLVLAGLFTLGMLVVGVMLIASQWQVAVGWAMLLLGVFAGLRTIDNAWTSVLYIQGRDAARVSRTFAALVTKLGTLAILLVAGVDPVLAACAAAVLAEAVLFIAFGRLVHRPLREIPVPVREPEERP